MKRLLISIFFFACASQPTVIELLPEKEQLCGFVKVGTHCCVARDPPMLRVKCVDMEVKEEPTDPTPPEFKDL